MDQKQLDTLCVNTIRMLAADMVETANSGHPGLPLGAAPMAYALWSRHLKHNPANPTWPDRDRFVLSAGHGSSLLYALLHLTGYRLSLEELKRFRQWGSLTPGHPEYGLTPGVECTTGPLGQGLAMAVGMAVAERHLAAAYNKPEHRVIDHNTYVLLGDGDLMEGVASEAASLAGTLGLGKLICLYDDNHISIEGDTDLAFREDVPARFEAYGWQVDRVADGNDIEAVDRAISAARAVTDRPSLIAVRTHIGFGSPKQDMASAHGEPLGAEAMAQTREFYGWPGETFHIPEEAAREMGRAMERGKEAEAAWQKVWAGFTQAQPDLAAHLADRLANKLPQGWAGNTPRFAAADGPLATRAASGKVLNALAAGLPCLMGGSADLAPSNKTYLDGLEDFSAENPAGRNLRFGVREHAMGAAVNGLALHGGFRPYGGTFMVFSDYMRPAIRLAALMKTESVFIFTHDSVAVGEDGPTHQPVEHLAALRAIPGLTVIRPADANEVSAAWQAALTRPGPTALALSRQKLPILDLPEADPAVDAARGGYVLVGEDRPSDIILMATGAEVHLALQASQHLAVQGIVVRVVSLPSWEIFLEQDEDYRNSVLPPEVTVRLAVEAGVSLGWSRFVGAQGAMIGLDRFGASAPGGEALDKLGFNVENVVGKAKELLGR